MPVLTVTALIDEATAIEPILTGIAERLAGALGRPVDDIWVRLVEPTAATSGRDADAQRTQHPTFELVTGPLGSELERAALEAVAAGVAKGFGVPTAAVWGRFVALEPGRLISGGAVA